MPAELIAVQPELSHIRTGLCHGSLWIRDCTDRLGFEHANEPPNRSRFARLAILYGWIGANDHQFIYLKDPPHLVFSVDHGHFFPGGPNWTAATLAGAPQASPDPTVISGCALTDVELRTACLELEGVDGRIIAAAIAAPLDDWGISANERIVVAEYLFRRRSELLVRFGGTP